MLCCVVLCCVELSCIVLCCVALYCVALCCVEIALKFDAAFVILQEDSLAVITNKSTSHFLSH